MIEEKGKIKTMGQTESTSFQPQKQQQEKINLYLPILCQPEIGSLCKNESPTASDQSLETIYTHAKYPGTRSIACKKIYPSWQKQCPDYFKRQGGSIPDTNKDGVYLRLSETLLKRWDGLGQVAPEAKLSLFNEIKKEVNTLANCIRGDLAGPTMKRDFALLDSQITWKYLWLPSGQKPLVTAFDWLVLLSRLEDFRIHYLLQYDPAVTKQNFAPESSLRDYCKQLKCTDLTCRPLPPTTARPSPPSRPARVQPTFHPFRSQSHIWNS
jgi:hypothetical protein